MANKWRIKKEEKEEQWRNRKGWKEKEEKQDGKVKKEVKTVRRTVEDEEEEEGKGIQGGLEVMRRRGLGSCLKVVERLCVPENTKFDFHIFYPTQMLVLMPHSKFCERSPSFNLFDSTPMSMKVYLHLPTTWVKEVLL